MFCIATYPLTTFLVSKLQSFAVNAWICFVKAMGTHALQIQSFDIKALKLWLCQSQIPFTGAATESLLPTQRQSPPATENDINVVGLGEVERIEALELSNISRLAVIDSLDEVKERFEELR